jgi:hypothetical protein
MGADTVMPGPPKLELAQRVALAAGEVAGDVAVPTDLAPAGTPLSPEDVRRMLQTLDPRDRITPLLMYVLGPDPLEVLARRALGLSDDAPLL